jgi:glyceraldehyde 3-phosphate dehydrogenase
LVVGGKKIKVLSVADPEKLPWKSLGVDYVVESTGRFKDHKEAEKHLKAGAKRVLISAPSDDSDITVVYGVNDDKLKKEHKIISVASCTTNCLAPLAKVLDDNFGIKRGFMTTVHGYTSSQALVDGPNKKLRRGRAAGVNIVPTSSGATSATSKAMPQLKGKMDGVALRVPVAAGSIVDFVAELNKNATKDQINEAFKKAANGKLKGVLQYTEDEIVSSDVIGNLHSSIIDGMSTQSLGNLVKVLSWYDNEYGYSCRMVDVLKKLK